MPRSLAALLVALIAGILVMPASARAHGHDHAGHRALAATEASAPAARMPSGAVAVRQPASVAAVVASRASTPACDRDCDHPAGMSGCLCMAACVALALPDLPTITPAAPAAGPRPADVAPWRPTALVPPTPPPRA